MNSQTNWAPRTYQETVKQFVTRANQSSTYIAISNNVELRIPIVSSIRFSLGDKNRLDCFATGKLTLRHYYCDYQSNERNVQSLREAGNTAVIENVRTDNKTKEIIAKPTKSVT